MYKTMARRDERMLLSLLIISTTAVVQSQAQGCTTANGRIGRCININQCPEQLALLNQALSSTPTDEVVSLLRRAICSSQNSVLFVCCSTSENRTPPPPSPPRLPIFGTTRPTVSLGNLLPTQCGRRPLVDRIVSGEDAPLRGWPWIALLEAAESGRRSSPICGGVLISERYVLTAAHCVDPRSAPTLTNIRLGEHTLSRDPDCINNDCAPPYEIFGIEEIIIHDQYGIPHNCSRCNDIALLRLSRSVQFKSLNIQPICLPQDFQRDLGFPRRSLNTKPAWVAGWGITDFRSTQPSNVLQQVKLPFDESLCSLDFRVFPDRDMVLCAGGQRQDTCRGDSGGPMVMGNEEESQSFLIGIVSKGPLVCGAANTGGLYTNVYHYIPWITQSMRP